MRIKGLLEKLLVRIETEGIRKTLRNQVYFNRKIIVIEMEIPLVEPVPLEESRYVMVDATNLKEYESEYDLRKVYYYLNKGAKCGLLCKGKECMGQQLFTTNNNYLDLRKIGISLKPNDVYLFGLFVYPRFRGTDATKVLAHCTFNYLRNAHYTNMYGYYFADNIQSLWYHRAFLKAHEIKKLPAHKIGIIEIVNRRPFLQI